MAETAVLWAGNADSPTGDFDGGTWADLANATGPSDGQVAKFTTTTGNGPCGWGMHFTNFGAQAAIGTQPTSIDSIVITLYWWVSNVQRWTADMFVNGAGQQFLNVSATVGASQQLTAQAGLTWDDLGVLDVLLGATKSGPRVEWSAVDAASVQVFYTP